MKYIFFDIDGTLTDANPGGKILESTYRTLDKLRENGHFVSIATGRAQWMAKEFSEIAGIHNLVTDGGNGIVIDGKVKHILPLDFEKANRVIDTCIENHYPFAVALKNEPGYYSNTRDIEGKQLPSHVIIDESIDFHQVDQILKIFIKLEDGKNYDLPLDGLDYMKYFEEELIIEPAEKYRGILEMVELMGGKEEDIVVFGDGHNDYSMIKAAPLGIAMGNASDELKAVADFVTKRNDEDGIEYACKYFGWI